MYVIELDNPTSGNQSNRQATEQPKPDYTGNYFIRILIFDYFYDDHFIFVWKKGDLPPSYDDVVTKPYVKPASDNQISSWSILLLKI